MASKVLKAKLLDSGKAELKRVRRYVVDAFGMAVWEESYAQIQASITRVREFPECGHVVDELSGLTADRFREVHCGKNRIIYEIRDDTIYVHLIIEQRRDLTALLQKIILQV
ncbi:type II toxin-antitoxin system RelE/ParE family toxin [Cupriavidus sp. AcVe19-6a]|uniref:type II toxin-antitoxin system RelE/ParE family toxin n=1 Tax=Cupriavidus sp. AcVe19-6a TaxID=2821358 RepID=UPI001AE9293B|nr:type II toxin-antitoxin system RelE/ParE family toxin [Cupriavidus sp. AcVe19-6a]MBP0639412.1 type II toxin-antitoxin system RelE/ParE family toxin [Cupriavidus sp. AcVe19-6a]